MTLKRIVVGIDPAVSLNTKSAETGIIVGGMDEEGRGHILEDLSGKYTPSEWAEKAIEAYWQYGADRVVAEVNQGGDLVAHTLRLVDPNVSFKSVRAKRGKQVRAEPIVALYEQNRIVHKRHFPELEEQMCTFTGLEGQPSDRMDALVWVLTELFLEEKKQASKPALWTI